MKKAAITMLMFWGNILLLQAQILINTENISNIINVHLFKNNTVAYEYFLRKEGKISSLVEYYIDYNSKHFGPYDEVDNVSFNDAKAELNFDSKKDSKWYRHFGSKNMGPYDNMSWIEEIKDNSSYSFIAEIGKYYYLITQDAQYGPYEKIGEFGYLPNNQLLFYSAKKAEGWFLYLGKNSVGPYDDMQIMPWWISKNTLTYLYKRTGKWKLVIENKECGEYDKIGWVRLSADCKRYAFVGIDGEKSFLVRDGEMIGPYSAILEVSLTDNGDKIIYKALEYDDIYACIIYNTRIIDRYSLLDVKNISELSFSPYENEIVYVEENENHKKILHIGEKASEEYDTIGQVDYSPDGSEFVYDASINGQSFLICGNEKAGPFDEVKYATYSPNGKRIAYVTRNGDSEYIRFGEKILGPYSVVSDIVFSPDSEQISYVAETNGKAYLYYGNIKYGPYEYISSIEYLENVNKFRYSAKKGNIDSGYVILNNKEYVGSVFMNKAAIIDNDTLKIIDISVK